jgi:hypothetical protein
MVLFETDAKGVVTLELKRHAPRTVDVDRVADRVETSQGMEIEPRDIRVFGSLGSIERI